VERGPPSSFRLIRGLRWPGLRSDYLKAAVRGLDPGSRALLDLSLRRRIPDHEIARLLSTSQRDVAHRRADAIRRLGTELEIARPEELTAMIAALAKLPPDAFGVPGSAAPIAEAPGRREARVRSRRLRRVMIAGVPISAVGAVAAMVLAAGGDETGSDRGQLPPGEGKAREGVVAPRAPAGTPLAAAPSAGSARRAPDSPSGPLASAAAAGSAAGVSPSPDDEQHVADEQQRTQHRRGSPQRGGDDAPVADIGPVPESQAELPPEAEAPPAETKPLGQPVAALPEEGGEEDAATVPKEPVVPVLEPEPLPAGGGIEEPAGDDEDEDPGDQGEDEDPGEDDEKGRPDGGRKDYGRDDDCPDLGDD
jgi:hypothetical protein